MYIDAVQRKDEIIVWTRDEKGNLSKHEAPAPYYCYQVVAESDLHSMFGHPVAKKEFDNRQDYQNFVDSHGQLFESDISPLHKYLSDTYYKTEGVINKAFFDIEVDFDLNDGLGYPTPDNPFGKINSLSMFDVKTQTYHQLMLTDDKTIILKDEYENLPVKCWHCVTEKQLLDTFMRLIEDVDLLSGWNSGGYDVPYIMARAIKLYGIDRGYQMLSRDGFKTKSKDGEDKFGNNRIIYTPVGRVHLDMLELYKKFTFEESGSNSLDSIAEKELDMKKIEYEGDLGELYRTNPQKFFEYSLHDSRLLKMLDEKLKHIELAIKMSRQATILYHEVFGSIKPLEHSIRNYAHFERKIPLVLPDKNPHNKREKFPGGFVIDTKPGVYRWTQSIDLASLYPSVIRMCNISPETHVLQCVQGHKAFIKIVEESDEIINIQEVDTSEIHQIKASEVKRIMKEENLTLSANGSLFDNNIQGLIPEVLSLWYEERKRVKKLAQELDKQGKKEEAEYNSDLSFTLKVYLNSLYGAISNPFSRFFTLNCAKSVTLTAQTIEKFQTWKADGIVTTAAA